jgi:NADPH2:quinone reductase
VKAVVISETGGPEVLRYEDVPEPQPEEDEVLVRIEAAGVNHFDLNLRAGMAQALPLIPGGDGAGRREDTGARVLVSGARLGTYAELAAIKPKNIWPRPEELEASTAAALGVPYQAAWMALVEIAELQAGETILVQSGSSGTSLACIDLARSIGARIYATASEHKLDRLRELGVEALGYDDERLGELDADVVYDPVGSETFERSLAALGRGGRLVTPGALGSPDVALNLWTLVGKRGRIAGVAGEAAPREVLETIIVQAAKGELKPVIDRELPLAEAAEAHRAIEARETFGKVILRPSDG